MTDHIIKLKKGQRRSQAVVEHLKTLMDKGVLDAILVQKPTLGGRSYRRTSWTMPIHSFPSCP
jgi:hypothetical protein